MKTFQTFVQELNESYHSLITVGKEKITIFVNPNSSEIKESMSQFGRARWAADSKSKKLYVWTSEATHSEVMPQLKLERNVDYVIYGQSAKDEKLLKITQMDQIIELDDSEKIKVGNHDWSFLKRFFSNYDYITSLFKKENQDLISTIKEFILNTTKILNIKYNINRNEKEFILFDFPTKTSEYQISISFMTYNNEFSISVKTAEETINSELILNSNYSKKFVVDEIEIVKTLIMNFLLRLSLLNKMQEDKIKNIGSIQATLFFDSLDIKGYDIKKWVHSSFKNKLVKK